MTDVAQQRSQPIPAWLIRTIWTLHRALLRFSAGRLGLRRPTDTTWGMLRLQTVGRRSGRVRRAIVGYIEDGPNIVTPAMNGWLEPDPAWWLNPPANPGATVLLPDGPRAVRARAAVGEEAGPAVAAVRRSGHIGVQRQERSVQIARDRDRRPRAAVRVTSRGRPRASPEQVATPTRLPPPTPRRRGGSPWPTSSVSNARPPSFDDRRFASSISAVLGAGKDGLAAVGAHRVADDEQPAARVEDGDAPGGVPGVVHDP